MKAKEMISAATKSSLPGKRPFALLGFMGTYKALIISFEGDMYL